MTTCHISTKAELKMLHPYRGSNQNRPLRQWRLVLAEQKRHGWSLRKSRKRTPTIDGQGKFRIMEMEEQKKLDHLDELLKTTGLERSTFASVTSGEL
jgi:hypothetical protein